MTYAALAAVLGQGADPISGGAGWVGAGLLGMVLAWLLLKHLPEKDRQIRELIKDKDAQLERKDAQIEKMLDRKNEQLKQMLEAHDVTVKRMHVENKSALEQVIQHCKDETSRSAEMLQRDLNQLGEAIEELTLTVREGRQPRRRRQPPPPNDPAA